MKAKSSSTSTGGGVGLLGLLGILFVGLKLTGYIDWSWWWVTLPFLGGLAIVLGLGLGFLIGWILIRLLSARR